MKRIFKSGFIIMLSTTIFVSCSDNNETIDLQTENLNDKQKLMQETSILLGKMLTNSEVKTALNQKMKEVDEDAEIVSFAYLFEQENGMRKNEISYFSKRKINSSNVFKTALQNEFEKNEENYKTIANVLETKSPKGALARTSETIAEDLATLLVSEELQIFFPFDPEYEDDDTSVEEFYVSYDPLNNAQTNTGYKFYVGLTDIDVVDGMTNDFLDDNPVYIIVPIDPCDILGRECNFTELLPVVEDPIDPEVLPPSANQFLIHNPGGFTVGNTGGTNSNNNNNNPVPTTTLLTTNTNHNNIPETDIISSYIPRIQINGTSWMGFGGTHQKLRFFRGTTDGAVTQNADGTITATGTKYTIKDFRCKRKYVKRKKRWLGFDAEFDPDWNMTENTQVMAVFSLHHISASASAELTAKSGFKIEGGEIKPHTEASGSVKINFSLGSSKFRANAEMSRRMILATIIGPGTTGRTINDNGVQYNVKKIGIVDYYFKHFYTDL
jgi:hypothetical protein